MLGGSCFHTHPEDVRTVESDDGDCRTEDRPEGDDVLSSPTREGTEEEFPATLRRLERSV